ncbi:hypothetical protein [endosymbiont GvMRE of Glomus versiforme]|uniref:hypothetical protein n=1 Tax=endosymbiont GvMRE of Glomus versiforme TaxID=2039283 RepID=UPI0011C3586A|nr:hypothetical protein [endosymbiont GvMRE of Glomus versiforme]
MSEIEHKIKALEKEQKPENTIDEKPKEQPKPTNPKCDMCKKETNKLNKLSDLVGPGPQEKLCDDCFEKFRKNMNKPNPNRNNPNLNRRKHICEKCDISCWVESENAYLYRTIRYEYYDPYGNFKKEVHIFSDKNCSCAEEFKRNHQQDCGYCGKREWPEMKKGWAIDFELRITFCSPSCNYKYHKELADKSIWKLSERNQTKQNNSATFEDEDTNKDAICSKCGETNLGGYWTGSKKYDKLCNDCKKEIHFKWEGLKGSELYLWVWEKGKVVLVESGQPNSDKYVKTKGYYTVIWYEIPNCCFGECKHPNTTKTKSSSPKPKLTIAKFLAKKTKLFPVSLTLSVDDKSSVSKAEIEKKYSEKEILILIALSKKLEKKTTVLVTDKELYEEEKETANLFYELAKSSEEKAMKTFEDKYGKGELDALLSGSQEQQTKKNYLPWIIGGGLIASAIVGSLVFYFVSKKKKS